MAFRLGGEIISVQFQLRFLEKKSNIFRVERFVPWEQFFSALGFLLFGTAHSTIFKCTDSYWPIILELTAFFTTDFILPKTFESDQQIYRRN